MAEALRQWLPSVIQVVQPWMSDVDIDKGARWSKDIAAELEEASFGVICLTPENLEAPWILFEAGALSKKLEQTFVCPYLFDVEPAQLKGPLVQFQAAKAERDDTRKLVYTINRALDATALPADKLDKAFEKWWPELEQALRKLPEHPETPQPKRSVEEMIGEMLEIVRSLERNSPDPMQAIFSRKYRSRATLTGRPSFPMEEVLEAINTASRTAAQTAVMHFATALQSEGILPASSAAQSQVGTRHSENKVDSNESTEQRETSLPGEL